MREAIDKEIINKEQERYWSTNSGEKWITFQSEIDTVFQSVNDRLFERAKPLDGEHVLDVGCGTGATSLDLAKSVGPTGRIVGLDISKQLLSVANNRSRELGHDNVEYILADAQSHPFDNDGFDLLTSRFGLMFFETPVDAFINLSKALKPGGRVSFVTWAKIEHNPWFEVPRDAAVARLGKPSPGSPTAPGPLAFADINYVTDILGKAGFTEVAGIEETVDLFHPGTVEVVALTAANIGPAARIIKQYDGTQDDVVAIGDGVVDAFRGYQAEDGVRVPANLNFFSATRR